MTTITREWLQQTIAEFENTRDDIPFGLSDDDAKILIVLKRALAVIDAEPVRYLNKFSGTCVTLEQQSNAADDVAVYIPLYAAPPVQETGVYKDMLNIISLLENNEWAEHCTSTVLGSLLESEITRLVGKEQPAPVVPEEMPKGLADQIVSLLTHNIGDKFLAQKIWNACRAAMLQGVEPVSNHDELALYYLQGQKDGLEWAAQLAEANHPHTGDWLYDDPLELAKAIRKGPDMPEFAGSSPVTQDGWISCSERIPEQGAYISAVSKHGEYVAGQVIDDWLDLHDGTSFGLDEVYLWMMLPPLPASPQQ